MSRDPVVVSLSMPAKSDYLLLGRLVLTGIASVRTLTDEELADLKLVLTEACANIVRHAYGSGAGEIHVTYELTDDVLTLLVADDGRGIGERGVPGVDDVGLGLRLIEALSDELEIRAGEGGRGTVVRLRRTLAPATDVPAPGA